MFKEQQQLDNNDISLLFSFSTNLNLTFVGNNTIWGITTVPYHVLVTSPRHLWCAPVMALAGTNTEFGAMDAPITTRRGDGKTTAVGGCLSHFVVTTGAPIQPVSA